MIKFSGMQFYRTFLILQRYYIGNPWNFKTNLGYFLVFLRTLVRKGSLCEFTRTIQRLLGAGIYITKIIQIIDFHFFWD